MGHAGRWYETVCGRSTVATVNDGPEFVLDMVGPDRWAMLPHRAQCKSCRRRGGLAARCLCREDEVAIEIGLHAIARLLEAIPAWEPPPMIHPTQLHARLRRRGA